MKQLFVDKNFQSKSLWIIEKANEIIEDYQAQGYTLTLRQLYYQFVGRDLIPNTQQSYNRIGSIVNDARLAGLIDWGAIEDRTRNIARKAHWNNPKGGIESLRDQYRIDMWKNQPERVEVWIEKEALVGVIDKVCTELDVPYFACRGYVSQSEQYAAYQRFSDNRLMYDQQTTILHFGDHDPSGIDMTRDNRDRLDLFTDWDSTVNVERIALNMDQIEAYQPPPNFAKITDSRFKEYQKRYGNDSWELDALEPSVINDLIRKNVDRHRDLDYWAERNAQLMDDLATFDGILGEL